MAVLVLLSACNEGGDDTPATFVALTCGHDDTNDSQLLGSTINGIRSHQHVPNVYRSLSVHNGTATIGYMVHGEENSNNKAMIVLIAGGQLNAGITGPEGGTATSSSGNFLVRSAHLFAERGYKVVTIDRPSDYLNYTGTLTGGYAMDSYRTSQEHYADISAIITAENSGGTALRVVIAGTSRGAISAVAQHTLADYLLISSPVTSGGNGTPVGHASVSPSSVGDKPVHLIWHKQDACHVSKPAGSASLTTKFANVSGVEISGGYNQPDPASSSNPDCVGGLTFHGFVGIESCVVDNATDWLDARLLEP